MTYQDLILKGRGISIEDVRAFMHTKLDEVKHLERADMLDLHRESGERLINDFHNGRTAIAYFYKKVGKYPARVYLFSNWRQWRRRNLRPMGLHNEFPFCVRPMVPWEILDELFLYRMQYFQYESWRKLIGHDLKVGVQSEHINELLKLQQDFRYLLDGPLYDAGVAYVDAGYQLRMHLP